MKRVVCCFVLRLRNARNYTVSCMKGYNNKEMRAGAPWEQ